MKTRQQWILPPPRPLADRLGQAFFTAVPDCPGVYFMKDALQKTIYVGQSGNLRQRLRSYKNAHPNHTPRRTWRLVQSVHSIEWEVHPSAAEAIEREETLLRTLKPKFNRANIYPEGYKYVSLCSKGDQIVIEEQSEVTQGGLFYGAFKGTHRRALPALARLLYRLQTRQTHWWQVPRHWNDRARRISIKLPVCSSSCSITRDELIRYFSGESPVLVDQLLAGCAALPSGSAFDETWILEDLATLDSFYIHGPARNRALASQFSQIGTVIPATELNALLLRARNGNRAQSPVSDKRQPGCTSSSPTGRARSASK